MTTEQRRHAAAVLIRRGAAVIPVPAGEKNPGRRGWEALRISKEEIPSYWTNGQNVGVLVGEPSGWRVDVDLDADEAVTIAGRFLPPTLTSGRVSRPHSHWWYIASGAKSRDWKDTDGSKLVELRSTGRQTLVAPSVHPDGDEYVWHSETGLKMAEVGATELARRLRELATAVLIARHLPLMRTETGGGGRHDYALALAGFLLRPGRLEEGLTLKVLKAAWDAKGWPGEKEKREAHRDLEGIVRDTAEKLAAGESVVGGPTLEEMAPGIVLLLCKWWGWERRPKAEDKTEECGILLSEVVPERVRWLWKGRIALGKLNLVDGDPGTGKSAAATDLAARVSVGKPWPDGAGCEAGGVVILSAEDGLADTIRPRFDAAGGDPSRAVAVSTVADAEGNERQIAIPDDLHVIEAAIERVDAVLIVIDPLMAFLPGEVNSHRDQDVRRALAPLARLAERTEAAVVVVRHLNKGTGGNALYRGGGSIGIVGAARSGLLIAKHPEDDDRRVLASIKSNLAAPAPSLVFGLESTESGAVVVEWKGESDLDASALLSAPTDHEERSTAQAAQDFLRDMLSGRPEAVRDIRAQANEAGLSWRTVERAKAALGVKAAREGEPGKRGGGAWVWALPNIKSATLSGWRPKLGVDRTDTANVAYPSQDEQMQLRPPTADGLKTVDGAGGLNRPLSADLAPGQSATLSELAARREVEAAGTEMRRSNSGPALALKAYLEKPNDERLEWLTKAVLKVRGLDTANWRDIAAAVKIAAEDPANHPLDCDCEVCL